jgi:hypothetical protein
MVRAARWIVALVGSCLALVACGGGGGSFADRQAASSAPESSSAASTSPSAPLADGLLPAEAFGDQATVVPLSREQLQQSAGLAPAAKDLKVSPPECAAAVQGTQPDVDAFDDIAAQSATAGGVITVEMLLSGGPTAGSLDAIGQAVSRCPSAQISSTQFGTATVTFEAVPVDDLGDGTAALRFTTTLTQPDGARISVPALVGVVRDGNRVVTLVTLSQTGAAPDTAAFTSLLNQAYEAQAEALD